MLSIIFLIKAFVKINLKHEFVAFIKSALGKRKGPWGPLMANKTYLTYLDDHEKEVDSNFGKIIKVNNKILKYLK